MASRPAQGCSPAAQQRRGVTGPHANEGVRETCRGTVKQFLKIFHLYIKKWVFGPCICPRDYGTPHLSTRKPGTGIN